MSSSSKLHHRGLVLLVLVCIVLSACQPLSPSQAALSASATPLTPSPVLTETLSATFTPTAEPTATLTPTASPTATQTAMPTVPPATLAEPAGCLSGAEQANRTAPQDMLAYADSLLSWSTPLARRQKDGAWNAITQTYYPVAQSEAFSFDVADVADWYQLQKALNALHVAGFVAWLRSDQGARSLLAIPLNSSSITTSVWSDYITAYWQERDSTPAADPQVIPALKLPPCNWMVEQGYTTRVSEEWWSPERVAFPDYASVAQAYVADNNDAAFAVAQRIDWLGPDGVEGPQSMCGPLVWSIMNDAGAFLPGLGNWSPGPKVFWLSKPRTNGRPWNLFPEGMYQVTAVPGPMFEYDFVANPLYPGDFIYSYSQGRGFEHMFLVTEIDAEGNVYTVTNIIKNKPVSKFTIEHAILFNIHDLSVGLIRNQWQKDRKNGRTGDHGFDLFRWAWMQKNISGQPAEVTAKPGDTFALLAEQWRTPAAQIAEFNGRQVSDTLTVGETLLIPPVTD